MSPTWSESCRRVTRNYQIIDERVKVISIQVIKARVIEILPTKKNWHDLATTLRTVFLNLARVPRVTKASRLKASGFSRKDFGI